MPRKASETKPPRATKSAKPEPAKTLGTFRLPPSRADAGVTPAKAAKEIVIDVATVTCPSCGGAMWDNRENKRNPRAPDFKCKRRTCEGVIWPRANVRYVEAQQSLMPGVGQPVRKAANTAREPDADRPLVWRDDSIREAPPQGSGTFWSYLLSTDGTVAWCIASTKDRQGDMTLAHSAYAWTYPHRSFNDVHQGEESGAWCKLCHGNSCVGVEYARKTLANGPQRIA